MEDSLLDGGETDLCFGDTERGAASSSDQSQPAQDDDECEQGARTQLRGWRPSGDRPARVDDRPIHPRRPQRCPVLSRVVGNLDPWVPWPLHSVVSAACA